MVFPISFAAVAFSTTPPIAPTCPASLMVPVRVRELSIGFFSIAEMTRSVISAPALGPSTSSIRLAESMENITSLFERSNPVLEPATATAVFAAPWNTTPIRGFVWTSTLPLPGISSTEMFIIEPWRTTDWAMRLPRIEFWTDWLTAGAWSVAKPSVMSWEDSAT